MSANEVTIVDMMKILAPVATMQQLIYNAMDHFARTEYTDDEQKKRESYRAGFDSLYNALDIAYDRR